MAVKQRGNTVNLNLRQKDKKSVSFRVISEIKLFNLKKIWNAVSIKNPDSLHKSKTFCIMPWVHFHVTQQGTVTPCCQAPWQEDKAFGNINNNYILDIWNSEGIRAFRKTIMNGGTDERCASCFKREKAGFTSLRQITNKKYAHKFQEALYSRNENFTLHNTPVYFDIRFSNICNLRCRICGPWSSSSWYNDAVELGMTDPTKPAITRAFSNTQHFFEELEDCVEWLEELYFAGGEPLVMDEHYQLLELLIAKGKTHVKLTYNTNFSSFKYKHHNITELWKKFPNISLAASLDAEGKRGEFLRKNLVWEKVVENRIYLKKELPHVEFVVSPTISIYNLLHLPHFHRSWVNQGLINAEDFIPTLLVVPQELGIAGIPKKFRQKAIHAYSIHLVWIKTQPVIKKEKSEHMIQQFENVLNSLNNARDESLENFKKNFEALDNLRNESTAEVFPELKEFVTTG